MTATTPTTDVAAFVLARLDEDEAAAKAATPGPWVVGETHYPDGVAHEHIASMGPVKKMLLNMGTGYLPSNHEQDAAHIARHDPARVLAQVAALREIVELHAPADHTCVCANVYEDGCPTLRALASIWRGHDEYDERWSL